MGTRADFYIGRGKTAVWIGSIAFDGDSNCIDPRSPETEKTPWGSVHHLRAKWPPGEHLFDATTEEQFRERLQRFFQYRDDVTLPEQGWPWPWENSDTTDYAYAFDGGKVYGTCFGHGWWLAHEEEGHDHDSPKDIEWPTMERDKCARPGSQRSGVMVITAPSR